MTFQFEWRSNVSAIQIKVTFKCDIRIWVKFQLKRYFNFNDIPIWVAFIFEWHYNLSDIPIWGSFPIEWYSNLNDISILVIFYSELHYNIKHSNLSYNPIQMIFQLR